MDILFGLATSLHLGLAGDYNSIHPHIRLEQEELSVGAFYNSMEKVSTYLSYTFDLNAVDLEVGAVTGYDKYFDPVMPYARLSKDFGNRTVFVTPVGEVIDGKYKQGVVIGLELYLNK